jgi:hypothetical protein
MKQDIALKRLEELLEEEFDQIRNNLIFCDNDQYYAFNIYQIVKNSNGTVDVIKGRYDPKTFSSFRIALSWCIADKYQQLNLAYRLIQLDREKLRISADISARQSLVRQITNAERKEAAQLKITTKKTSIIQVEKQLTKCVNLAKYWQIQGFNRDETARFRRTQTTR